jgi:hypothetical protein
MWQVWIIVKFTKPLDDTKPLAAMIEKLIIRQHVAQIKHQLRRH